MFINWYKSRKKSELYEMQDATSRPRSLTTTENVNIFRVKKKPRKPTGNLTCILFLDYEYCLWSNGV